MRASCSRVFRLLHVLLRPTGRIFATPIYRIAVLSQFQLHSDTICGGNWVFLYFRQQNISLCLFHLWKKISMNIVIKSPKYKQIKDLQDLYVYYYRLYQFHEDKVHYVQTTDKIGETVIFVPAADVKAIPNETCSPRFPWKQTLRGLLLNFLLLFVYWL